MGRDNQRVPRELTPAETAAVQLHILELLSWFTAFCKKHGLRYFALGGTVLGAVRHQGFIPWDDDGDVGMPRVDFDTFCSLAPREMPHDQALETARTNSAFPYAFAKLYRNDTTLTESGTEDLPLRHGVFLDIFPLDGIPASRGAAAVHRLVWRAARLRLATGVHKSGLRKLGLIARLMPRSTAVKLLVQMGRRWPYDRARRVVNAGGAWGYEREFGAPRLVRTGVDSDVRGRSDRRPRRR